MNNVNKPNGGEQPEAPKRGVVGRLVDTMRRAYRAWQTADIPRELRDFGVTLEDINEIMAEFDKALEADRKEHPFSYTMEDRARHMDILTGILEIHYSGFLPADRENICRLMRTHVFQKAGFIPYAS